MSEQEMIQYGKDDSVYEDAKKLVIENQLASVALLQSQFHIGYNRAARMIDALVEDGIISDSDGTGKREVYATTYHEGIKLNKKGTEKCSFFDLIKGKVSKLFKK